MSYFVEREIGGKPLRIESGKIGKQASGACTVRYGDTIVFCAATWGEAREDIDFFPLTMDYREKNYAAGKIPGGFFKREGRPTTKEILTMRLMDRPIRPLFPEGYKKEVAVSALVISADTDNNPDILAMIGASTALTISDIPFQGPTGSLRIGMDEEGRLLFNPSYDETENGRLDLVVSGTRDAITMVECGAKEVIEQEILKVLEEGHEVVKEIIGMIEELQQQCGREKIVVEEQGLPEALLSTLDERYGAELTDAIRVQGKLNRKAAENEIVERMIEDYFPEDAEESESGYSRSEVDACIEKLRIQLERRIITGGRRADNRTFEDIRDIACEVGILPRTHGSSLFTRGETQSLVIATLGTELDEQRIDGLLEERREKFMLHYDFPSFCVGEVWPNRGPKRREIGHGNLARRAVLGVLELNDTFPYTVRVTSDIMESNGSSSMATVCGASLALMDAGVPLRRPVAGIAMGMVKEGDDFYILSDIQGSEDHNGDIDFKVAGTEVGITALQLDCKVKGVSFEILGTALEQAKRGRLHILGKMAEVLAEARDYHSPYAPRVERFMINPEKIGLVIGPSGKTIRQIQDDTGCTIAVIDEGQVSIWGPDEESTLKARDMVETLTEDAEKGKIYEGKVVSIKDFGCFVEIIPGQEGMVHVSELVDGYVQHPSDVVSIGDIINVKCINIDPSGKIKLSAKEAENPELQARAAELPQKESGSGRHGDGRRPGGGRSRRDSGPRRDSGSRRGSKRPLHRGKSTHRDRENTRRD